MRRRGVLILVTLGFLLLVATAFPDPAEGRTIAPPSDYTIASLDGKFLLVVFVNVEQLSYTDYTGASACFCRTDPELRAKYPHAGLYRNDGSNSPLWTINWYDSLGNIYLSSDGKHLVRRGGSFGQELTFYENGKALKGYWKEPLVSHTEKLPLEYSRQYFFVPNYGNGVRIFTSTLNRSPYVRWYLDQGIVFDDHAKTVTLTFMSGERYLFDVTTGNILRKDEVTVPLPSIRIPTKSSGNMIEEMAVPVSIYNAISALNFAQDSAWKTFLMFWPNPPRITAETKPSWSLGDLITIKWNWTFQGDYRIPIALNVSLFAFVAAVFIAAIRQRKQIHTRPAKRIRG